jgi:uncharacterized protein (TIGR03118 family)
MKVVHIAGFAFFLVAAGCGGNDASEPSATPTETTASVEARLDGHGDRGDDVRIVQVVERKDIVSDLSGAEQQDQDLHNAWGLAFAPRGAASVSANGSGLAEIYDDEGNHLLPPVTIPPPRGGMPPSTPTGQVFNSNASSFSGDHFIFVTEDGTISGWRSGVNATLRVDNSEDEAVYKGVTIATTWKGRQRLYAANFHAGTIDVFDDQYHPVHTRGFRDWRIPSGFAPFNVQEIRGLLFVTYAMQDDKKHDDVKGPGNGFVSVFDAEGHLISHLVSRGVLNSPWGLALAPEGFGHIANHLLVGNFGDGKIHVFDLAFEHWSLEAHLDGALGTDRHHPVVIDGLWALRFGVDAGGFSSTDLYFTAGPNDEANGIFGELDAKRRRTGN